MAVSSSTVATQGDSIRNCGQIEYSRTDIQWWGRSNGLVVLLSAFSLTIQVCWYLINWHRQKFYLSSDSYYYKYEQISPLCK